MTLDKLEQLAKEAISRVSDFATAEVTERIEALERLYAHADDCVDSLSEAEDADDDEGEDDDE